MREYGSRDFRSPWKAKRKTLAACAGSAANANVATATADTPRARVFRAERDKRISETVNAPPAGSPGGVTAASASIGPSVYKTMAEPVAAE